MKNLKFALTLALSVAFVTVPLTAASVKAQDPQTKNQASAIMRGYRTGYSDGYQAGVNDVANNAARDFRNKTEYERGDRAYNSNYGPLEDYRDGYQQGFEVGYGAGFDRKPFDSSIPSDLRRRSDESTVSYPIDQNKSPNTTSPQQQSTSRQQQPSQTVAPDTIPRDTIMRVELLSNLSTDASQKGDQFQARVIEPKEYEGATIDGRVVSVKRAGRARSTAQ